MSDSDITTIMDQTTEGLGAVGSSSQLSSGESAAVAIVVLIVIIGGLGAAVGLLLWKYQPWNYLPTKRRDAVNNPVYEIDAVRKPATSTNNANGNLSTLKVIQTSDLLQNHSPKPPQVVDDSNPLYTSQSADGINGSVQEQNTFVNTNQSLLGVLSHQGQRAASEPREERMLEVSSRGIQQSHSIGDFAPVKETVVFSNGAARKPEPTVDGNEDYEPVTVVEQLFDDPDYGDVNY